MPHVFDYASNKFIQVHSNKVDQLPSGKIRKRQRYSEYTKFLLSLEPVPPKMAARLAARGKNDAGADEKLVELGLSAAVGAEPHSPSSSSDNPWEGLS